MHSANAAIMTSARNRYNTPTPPSNAVGSTEGIASTRNARPVTQPASSLPSVISSGLSRLACSVASVPAVRSPLIDPADSAGITSSIANSTRILCRLKTTAAVGPMEFQPEIIAVGPSTSRPMPISTSIQRLSATYQRAERIRWRSSSEVTSQIPLGRRVRAPLSTGRGPPPGPVDDEPVGPDGAGPAGPEEGGWAGPDDGLPAERGEGGSTEPNGGGPAGPEERGWTGPDGGGAAGPEEGGWTGPEEGPVGPGRGGTAWPPGRGTRGSSVITGLLGGWRRPRTGRRLRGDRWQDRRRRAARRPPSAA